MIAMISQEDLYYRVQHNEGFTDSERLDVIDEIVSYLSSVWSVEELERLSDKELASVIVSERNVQYTFQDFGWIKY